VITDLARPRAAFLVDAPHRSRGRGYYCGFALRITAGRGETELGDGGLVTWTAQLTNDAKERGLVSCIATERVAALAGPGTVSGEKTR
jgi:hypothetical protein